MADYEDPRPTSQAVGSTEAAVAYDNLITFDNVMNADSGTVITNRVGETLTPMVDVVSYAIAIVEDDIAEVDAAAAQALIDIQADVDTVSAFEDNALVEIQAYIDSFEAVGDASIDSFETNGSTAIATFNSDSVAAIVNMGWDVKGEFASGTLIEDVNDVLTYGAGVYRTDATLPYTTTGETPDADGESWYLVNSVVDIPAPAVKINFNDGLSMERGYGDSGKEVTFTRATTSTVTNKSGVITDLAIDEIGIAGKGMASFSSYDNELLYSEDFTVSPWYSLSGVGVLASFVGTGYDSPDLSTNATRIEDISATDSQYCRQVVYLTDGNIATACVSVKQVDSDVITLRVSVGPNEVIFDPATFQFSTGSFTSTPPAGVTYNVEKQVNGWYRLCLTIESTLDNATVDFRIFPTNNSDTSLLGSVDIFGAQVTRTYQPMPYKKTEDVVGAVGGTLCTIPAMNNIPANGEGWAIKVIGSLAEGLTDARLFNVSAESTILLRRGASGIEFYCNKDADVPLRRTVATDVDGEEHTFLCIYDPSYGIKIYIDGAFVIGNTVDMESITPITLTGDIAIGSSTVGSAHSNCYVRDFEIYHYAPSHEQAQLI